MKSNILHITILNVAEWRNWLEKNHLKEKKVGIILYKKHKGHPFISHREAMEEAINFGWIDTTIKRLDDNRFIRYFVRRGENANWSKNTLSYGKKLLLAGRMSPAGIERYKQGLKKKPHDFGIPDNPNIPRDLKKEFKKSELAYINFLAFPKSTRKMYFRWILRAKTKETRMKRIKSVFDNAKNNIKVLYTV